MKYPILKKKFDKEFGDIAAFLSQTKCPLSYESVRRVIYLEKESSAPILMMIGKHLGLSHAEIKKALQDSGDNDFWPLIGNSEEKITEAERGLITAYNAIKKKDPEKANLLADHLDLISQAIGLDLKDHTDKLRTSRPTRRSGPRGTYKKGETK